MIIFVDNCLKVSLKVRLLPNIRNLLENVSLPSPLLVGDKIFAKKNNLVFEFLDYSQHLCA